MFGLRQSSPGVCGLYGRVIVYLMATSFRRACANNTHLPEMLLSVSQSPLQAIVDLHCFQRLPNTRKSGSIPYGVTVSLSWVLVHTTFSLHTLRVSVSPVLGKFCNQIPLTFKIRFPWDSQSLIWIPRFGNLMWGLETLQLWENFLGIIVLSLGHQPGRYSI